MIRFIKEIIMAFCRIKKTVSIAEICHDSKGVSSYMRTTVMVRAKERIRTGTYSRINKNWVDPLFVDPNSC